MIWTLVLFLLTLLLIATLPIYPYSRRWGYLPAGVIALLLIVVLALIGLDYITLWYPWAPVDIER
jgi:Protein of unknown function (DUF3309)